MTELNALIVEDEENFRASLSTLVAREGYATLEVGSLEEARKQISEITFDVVLVDLGLPDGDGLELLRDDGHPQSGEFVVITGNASVDSAVAALREGALDYLTKPIDRPRLKSVLAHVTRTRELKQEVASLRLELRDLGRFGPIVGRSAPMQEVYDLITKVAPTSATAFVTGESGTGKELVAQGIHALSKRRAKPFLALNCGAMTATLIESELFGHEKGAFTGADTQRAGFFENADGGTLFLDEITEMPIELQVKLLRVLETGSLVRVGSTDPLEVDVRVIAASNRDPQKAVDEGALREDLLYRLNVFPIHLPPLRDRGNDIGLLAEHFLSALNEKEETNKRWSEAALASLCERPWSGNVRELKNAVERAHILADRVVGPEELPEARADGPAAAAGDDSTLQVSVGSSIADAEKRLILATLAQLDGDKKQASEVLGISLKTLYNRLNVYEASASGD